MAALRLPQRLFRPAPHRASPSPRQGHGRGLDVEDRNVPVNGPRGSLSPSPSPSASLAVCCCVLLGLSAVAAADVHPAAAVSVSSLSSLTPTSSWSSTPPVLRALTAAAARGKDEYDDYGDDDDDYDDDYDYYGTKKKKPAQAAAAPSETNVFNFVRIMVLRIVWGFASMFGFEEPLSEAFNGAFVPPGVDDYDDGGFGLDGDYR